MQRSVILEEQSLVAIDVLPKPIAGPGLKEFRGARTPYRTACLVGIMVLRDRNLEIINLFLLKKYKSRVSRLIFLYAKHFQH